MRQWLLGILFALTAIFAPAAFAQQCSPSELQNDVANCGTCGRDCRVPDVHAVWTCSSGQCANQGCLSGYYDLNHDGTCEYACTFRSAQEQCNGIDDNCDGQVDEGVVAPAVSEICGVSPIAVTAECTTAVTRACVNGAWQCGFPAGVCLGGNCATTAETCDNLDNNCNGLLNENVPLFGHACASDDGQPAPGDGLCRTTGTYACSGPNQVSCSATKAPCATLPGGCTEVCDGQDNDCDGLIDEPYTFKGSNAANFVKPQVTKISASPNLWITTYEVARSNAGLVQLGSGNGYVTSAPAGMTLDKTKGCSVAGKKPWTRVSPLEAEQVCTAMGGRVCTTANYISACQVATSPTTCTYGYAPYGAACSSAFTVTKFCNLGLSYDSDGSAANGDQDALLSTDNSALVNCYADWTGRLGNAGLSTALHDITGNAREITKSAANVYPLMGGSYLNDSELGAACGLGSFVADGAARLEDTGFRCCFDQDPTL